MESSKLIQLLKSLDKKEFKELEYFIKNPFHNKDKDAIKIFIELKRIYPKLEGFKIKKERIAKIIYGGYDEKNLKRLKYPISCLTKCVESFILWKTVEAEQSDRDFLLLKTYKSRGLDNFFFNKANALKRRFLKESKTSPIEFLLQYQLYSIIYRHPQLWKMSGKMETTLSEKNKFLDLFIISSKLTEALIRLNRKDIVVQGEDEILFLQNAIQEVESNEGFSNYPLFVIYLFFIKYLPLEIPFDKKAFLEVKELIFQNRANFDKNEAVNTFVLLLQYLLIVHEKGIEDLVEEYFEVYEFGIKNKILYENGYIMHFAFYNTVQAACVLKKFEWVKQFIEEQSPYLAPMHKENICLVSLAYLSCSKGNYDEALIYLRDVIYKKNYYYDIIIKTLTIRCFYEKKDSELLYNFTDTFSAYISRHKEMSNRMKNRISNFIRFVLLLEKNRFSRKESRKKLKEKLSQVDNIYFRTWLLEKTLEFD